MSEELIITEGAEASSQGRLNVAEKELAELRQEVAVLRGQNWHNKVCVHHGDEDRVKAMRECPVCLTHEIANLKEMLVYEEDFSSTDGRPTFQQGGKQHEMQDVVTAERCESMVQRIADLRTQVQKLTDERDEALTGAARIYASAQWMRTEVEALTAQMHAALTGLERLVTAVSAGDAVAIRREIEAFAQRSGA